jgi:Fe-S-cluster containining protein
MDRALDEVYEDIPNMLDCKGECEASCGAIAMLGGEWDRIKRAAGYTPHMPKGSSICPLLSPTGRCTVYSVRPYICRLWGTTRALRCPKGCTPERWLTAKEAHEIHVRIEKIAGPQVAGPVGGIDDLWAAIALERREQRENAIDLVRRGPDE